jgi:predicted AAA+ superfamily ATPase
MKEIPLDLYPVLLDGIRRPEVTLLTGVRQAGRTFLLKKLHRETVRRGMKTRFFDLEQPGTLRLFNREDAEVLEIRHEKQKDP